MLVLLHGFAGAPSTWDDVIAAWPAGAAVAADDLVALPLPGHGVPAAPSWEAALDHVEARIAAAGATGAPVAGYSLGARVALGLLARDAIPRALLVSGNPGLDDDDEVARAARRADDARWAALLRARGTDAFLDAWEAQPLFATAARVDPARRARRRAARAALPAEPLARALDTMGLAAMPDLRDALAERAARARLLVGGEDAKFVALARAAAARSPALVVEVAAEVGHDLTLEAPAWLAERLAAALAD